MKKYDFIIIGGGIVGLTVARALCLKKLGTVLLLEKEASLGMHSSGRNSGVIHAGIYYTPQSLKSKVCVEGSKRLIEYALEHNIPLEKTGKVIVASSQAQLGGLESLYRRALANGVRIEKISENRLRQIEPEARTAGEALYSPDTAVIDSKAVLKKLEAEIRELGVEIKKSSPACPNSKNNSLIMNKESVFFGHLINAAGLQADRVAHAMGAGLNYQILPFKGIYHALTPEAASKVHGSIYPLPDVDLPFLGVHVTRNVSGDVLLGPTAIPAFGRENYGILSGVDPLESPRIAWDLFRMVLNNQNGFRKLMITEFRKYRMRGFLDCVRELTPFVLEKDIIASKKVGIRAQLVDKKTGKLEMDFVIEKSRNATHILNAVSPAFTSSFAFAEIVVESILESGRSRQAA